jgi:hypothetical protein
MTINRLYGYVLQDVAEKKGVFVLLRRFAFAKVVPGGSPRGGCATFTRMLCLFPHNTQPQPVVVPDVQPQPGVIPDVPVPDSDDMPVEALLRQIGIRASYLPRWVQELQRNDFLSKSDIVFVSDEIWRSFVTSQTPVFQHALWLIRPKETLARPAKEEVMG